MEDLEQIKKDINEIKARNVRVEADKAWEVSIFRKVLIIVLTYIVATFVMIVIGVDNPYFNSLIPTVGFLLSVQSLPFAKRRWIKRYLSNKK